MNETPWWTYVQRVAGDVQGKEIADAAGFDKSAITRWKNGLGADPLFVVKFARAYNRPVGEALAASGLITQEEADIREIRVGLEDALAEASDDDLLAELRARLRNVGATTDTIDIAESLHRLSPAELAEVRKEDQALAAHRRGDIQAEQEGSAEIS